MKKERTLSEIKEILGFTYLKQIHAKCSELTYWNVSNTLSGKVFKQETFNKIMEAANELCDEKEAALERRDAIIYK